MSAPTRDGVGGIAAAGLLDGTETSLAWVSCSGWWGEPGTVSFPLGIALCPLTVTMMKS